MKPSLELSNKPEDEQRVEKNVKLDKNTDELPPEIDVNFESSITEKLGDVYEQSLVAEKDDHSDLHHAKIDNLEKGASDDAGSTECQSEGDQLSGDGQSVDSFLAKEEPDGNDDQADIVRSETLEQV